MNEGMNGQRFQIAGRIVTGTVVHSKAAKASLHMLELCSSMLLLHKLMVIISFS